MQRLAAHFQLWRGGREGENEGGWMRRKKRWEARLEFGVSYRRSQGQRRRGRAWEDISSQCNVRCLSTPAVIHNVTSSFFCLFCRYRITKTLLLLLQCVGEQTHSSKIIPALVKCILRRRVKNSSSPLLVRWKDNTCIFYVDTISVPCSIRNEFILINLLLQCFVGGYFIVQFCHPACREHGAMQQKYIFFFLTGISTWN